MWASQCLFTITIAAVIERQIRIYARIWYCYRWKYIDTKISILCFGSSFRSLCVLKFSNAYLNLFVGCINSAVSILIWYDTQQADKSFAKGSEY